MGLAVTNARMLFLSGRVSDISSHLMEISNRRETAAFKTQSVFTAYQNKLNSLAQSQGYSNTAKDYASSKATGTVVMSTLQGAGTGALTGASVGFLCGGPIGAAVGGAIGGVVGGIAGFFGGKAANNSNADLAGKLDQVANLNKQNIYNETQLKLAQAEYQGQMNMVHSADSALEQRQKQLETQLKAAQTELESVQKQRDKEATGPTSGFQCVG